MRATLLTTLIISIGGIALSGCASISESECITGSWSDIGYKDGVRGKTRGKLADYSNICSKYGITPDRQAYLTSFEQGVTTYCTYERGYARGENGSSFNQVCAEKPNSGFADGYDAGRALYEIHATHRSLIKAYECLYEAFDKVELRLDHKDLTPKERKRLRKKLYRIDAEAEDLRGDIRAHERLYDLPRYHFGG